GHTHGRRTLWRSFLGSEDSSHSCFRTSSDPGWDTGHGGQTNGGFSQKDGCVARAQSCSSCRHSAFWSNRWDSFTGNEIIGFIRFPRGRNFKTAAHAFSFFAMRRSPTRRLIAPKGPEQNSPGQRPGNSSWAQYRGRKGVRVGGKVSG